MIMAHSSYLRQTRMEFLNNKGSKDKDVLLSVLKYFIYTKFVGEFVYVSYIWRAGTIYAGQEDECFGRVHRVSWESKIVEVGRYDTRGLVNYSTLNFNEIKRIRKRKDD